LAFAQANQGIEKIIDPDDSLRSRHQLRVVLGMSTLMIRHLLSGGGGMGDWGSAEEGIYGGEDLIGEDCAEG